MTDLTKAKIQRKKRQAREFLEKAKDKVVDAGKWCVSNPGKTAALSTAAIGVAKQAGSMRRHHKNRKDDKQRQLQHWDPNHGVYYDLKKPLTSHEKVELSRRHDNGEPIYDILRSFGKLK